MTVRLIETSATRGNQEAAEELRRIADQIEAGALTGFTGIVETRDGTYHHVASGSSLDRLALIGAMFEMAVNSSVEVVE